MPIRQPSLFDAPPILPEGFAYREDFVSAAEEAALTARFAELPFAAFQFRGFSGKRRVVYFGWRYDFEAGALSKTEEIPDFLHPLRDRCAAFAGLEPAAFGHVLINEYAPGAPIGWHRDRPQFDKVVGVSLGAAGLFRFRREPRARTGSALPSPSPRDRPICWTARLGGNGSTACRPRLPCATR